MKNKLKQIRVAILEHLYACGYQEIAWQEIDGDTNNHISSGIYTKQLLRAIDHLNPHVRDQLRDKVIDIIANLSDSPALDANRILHDMLRNGVNCFHSEEGLEVSNNLKLLDLAQAKNNTLQVCYDFNSTEPSNTCDLLLFINGLPLVILRIIIDSPLLYSNTLKEILLEYSDMPRVLLHNSLVIVTNGTETVIGAQFTRRENLVVWRTLSGDNSATALDILKPETLIDFITNFISFSRRSRKFDGYNIRLNGNIDEKILGTYYQYYGVNRLIHSVDKSSKLADTSSKGKLGVIGNTYGSMLMHSMLFYAGKLLRESSKINPTIVCVLGDIDTENSFLQFLIKNRYLFGSDPIRAESTSHLKDLIAASGGGIIVASIQKFYFDRSNKNKPLSIRDNIFVIIKGLNVCSYGPTIHNAKKTKPAAKNFREKFLPNASMACFINITNASLDEEAFNLCGDYVIRYDMQTALRENIISKIYYEKRLTNYHISESELASQGNAYGGKMSSVYWPSSRGWQLLEKKLGNDNRLDNMARDIVAHFEQRHKISGGKAIIAVTSRQIAVSLYNKIIELRPDWESSSLEKGNLKVLMTHDANDPLVWARHKTTQHDRRLLRLRFGNPQDSLNIVIVRDMWLSGLYEPCLHIMYWDKLLEGHMLMEAVSRVNSMDNAKTAGLFVDYIGVERYLKLAVKDYLNKGGNDMVIMGTETSVSAIQDKLTEINRMLKMVDYSSYNECSKQRKHSIIKETRNHIFDANSNSLIHRKIIAMINDISGIYEMLISSAESKEFESAVQFLHSFKGCLLNLEPNIMSLGNQSQNFLMDDEVVELDSKYLYGIKDIHNINSASGDQKLLDNLMRIDNPRIRDLALQCLVSKWVDRVVNKDILLGKLLSAELRKCGKIHDVEMVDRCRECLTNLALKIIEHGNIRKSFGVEEGAYAVYNLLTKFQDKSGTLHNKELIDLSVIIVKGILANTSPDWEMMENARALLRVTIKHSLRKHNYKTSTEDELVSILVSQAEKLFTTD